MLGSTSRTSIWLFIRINAFGRPRARRRPGPRSPPPDLSLARARRHRPQVRLVAPFALDFLGVRLTLRPGRAPGVVVVGVSALGVRSVEDERRDALRVHGREQDAHRPALRVPHQRCPLDADGVHDGAYVVYARLEIGKSAGTVREPGSSLVEPDQAREGRKPLQHVRVTRSLPVEVEMGDEPWDEDEIERAAAGDLVGDVDVAALRVARLRRRGRHRGSIRREHP